MRNVYEMDDIREVRNIHSVHRRWHLRWLVGLLSLAAAFVVGALASNVIGNLGNELISWVWEVLVVSFAMNHWPWIITGVILVVSVAVVFYWRWQLRLSTHAFETMANLAQLDDSLLRLLASWIRSRDHEVEMKKILTELLRDASLEFHGSVHRACILLPSSDMGGEYLKVWAHVGMPSANVHRIQFYVGDDSDAQIHRGIAGEAYLHHQLLIARMKREGRVWTCDNPHYAPFHPEALAPLYRSFVCVPIVGINPNMPNVPTMTCLGVVCFDSDDLTVFDDPSVRIVLRAFARRIAAALLIYQQLP